MDTSTPNTPLHVDEPVHIFMRVAPLTPYGLGPDWCKLTLTNTLLAQLHRLATHSEATGRSVAEGLGDETEWPCPDGGFTVETDELCVRNGAFRIRGEFRHHGGNVGTVSMAIESLRKALADRDFISYEFGWQDGVLYVAGDDVDDFIELVTDSVD